MSNLKYIFAQPDYIDGIGNIYPIKLKNYDEFQEISKILYVSKNHFVETEIPLLSLIILGSEYLGFTYESIIVYFEKLFSIALKEEVKCCVASDKFWFQCGEDKKVDIYNYDTMRSIIMKQNLMFEQKVYKNPKVQEWADKAIKAKSKNSNITLEDIITTVSVYKGVHYNDLMDYTLYQLYGDFHRIRKMKKYDADIIFRSVSDKVTVEDFAESVNLFHNPYDDLFVDKGKLSKLNKVFGK